MSTPTKPRSIRMSDSVWGLVGKVAKEKGVSRSEVVLKWVSQGISIWFIEKNLEEVSDLMEKRKRE